MKNCWQILQIEITQEKKLIKRAYQRLLKTTKPDEKPEEFKVLYKAYQDALDYEEDAVSYEEDDVYNESTREQNEFHLSEEVEYKVIQEQEVQANNIYQEDHILYNKIINSIEDITNTQDNLEVFNSIENWKFLEDISLINNIDLISDISSVLFEEIEEFDEMFEDLSLNLDVIYFINRFCNWSKNWKKYNRNSVIFNYLDRLSTHKIDTLIDELEEIIIKHAELEAIKINTNDQLKIFQNIDDVLKYTKENNISDDKLFNYIAKLIDLNILNGSRAKSEVIVYEKTKKIIDNLDTKYYTKAIRDGYTRMVENIVHYLKYVKNHKLLLTILKKHLNLLENRNNQVFWKTTTSSLFGVYYQYYLLLVELKKPIQEIVEFNKRYLELFGIVKIHNFDDEEIKNYIIILGTITNKSMNYYFDTKNYKKALEVINIFDDAYERFKESAFSNEQTHFNYAMNIYLYSLTNYKLNNKNEILKSYIKINYYFKNTKNSTVKSYISLINTQMRKIGYISLIPNFIKDIFTTTSNTQFEKLQRDLFTTLPDEFKELLFRETKQYKILENVVEYWKMLVATKGFNVKHIPFSVNEEDGRIYYFDLEDFEKDGTYTIENMI
jgi:hypothetical protein